VSSIIVLFHKVVARFFAYYIQFVYWSSQIIITGSRHLLSSKEEEKFIYTFWHGDSFCFYPAAMNKRVYVFTTKDTRGDYIASIARYFGYVPIRVPDKSTGGKFFLKIRKYITKPFGFAVTLDGPLGPYHVPKAFPFVIAFITKRRVLPLSIKVKRKIQIKRRWDCFTIPLPFNKIALHVHDPVRIEKKDSRNDFSLLREKVKKEMDG